MLNRCFPLWLGYRAGLSSGDSDRSPKAKPNTLLLFPEDFLTESGVLYELIYICAHCYNKNKFSDKGQPMNSA